MREIIKSYFESYTLNLDDLQSGLIALLTKRLACSVIEIGCYRGAMSAIICDNLKEDKRLLCIDPYGTHQVHGTGDALPHFKEVLKKNKEKMMHIQFPSREELSVRYMSEFSYGLCFIDGSHTFEDAQHDLTHIYKYIKKPGIIILDDTEVKGVRQALEDFTEILGDRVEVIEKTLNPPHKEFEVILCL